VVTGEKEESSGIPRRSSSLRHYVISSSSSSSSRSRSRSSSRSTGRSRSPKYRHRRRRKHSHKRYHSGSKQRSRSRSRSHSRGPGAAPSASGEKKTGPYVGTGPYFGTNSTDPKMVAARLFVGSLPYDIMKDDLRGIFTKYGKIIGKVNLFVIGCLCKQ